MRRLSVVVASAAALALAACSRGTSHIPSPAPASGAAESRSVGADAALGAVQDRLLVRRARLDLEVDSPGRFAERAQALTEQLGGFVAQSMRDTDGGSDDGSVHLVLRVPAASLDATLDSLGALGRVRSRSTSAEDVTEQVVDLEARAANLRASRDRLRALLEQASAVSDVVAVERELARVQGELDALDARLEYLRGSVALAEITVGARRAVRLGPLGLILGGAARLVAALFVLP